MLQLKDLSINLIRDSRTIIEHLNFTLNKGEKAAVIGEEGNGKSTLLKCIYNPAQIGDYCNYSGGIVVDGKMAYLPQKMEDRFYSWTLAQYFRGETFPIDPEVLSALQIPAVFLTSQQQIGTLSGGEKVKIQLAKLLSERPDILLLDEPTNDIDLETLQWMENFIRNSRLSMLFVSHDETLIEHAASVLLHIEQLSRKSKCRVTVTHAKFSEYTKTRAAAFEKQAQIAKKQRSEYAEKMEKWQQIYNRVEYEQETITRANPSGGRLLKKKMKAVTSQGKRFEKESREFEEFPQTELAILTRFREDLSIPRTKVVLDLSLRELHISGRVLSENVHLRVVGKEHIGITGRNGCGKSTLLSVIWTELQQRRDLTACYMPQEYAEVLDDENSPIQFLTGNASRELIAKAYNYMGSMRFTYEEMNSKIKYLSGGQKAKILFLDMVLKDANVLVLDEPTRNFSPLSNPVIRETLAAFGGAIISVSHDRNYLKEVCETVYELTPHGLSPCSIPN